MVNTDLGALAAALTRRMMVEEEPILRSAGLSMWEYIVMERLGETSAQSQSELAKSTGRDPTRLIAQLDRLENAGLLRRTASSQDRRHNEVALTEKGREVLRDVRRGIRALEHRVLAALPAARRDAFRVDLETLGTAS